MKKIINIKNIKNNIYSLLAVVLLNSIFTMGVYAACNSEAGACRISDLRKAAKTEAIENKFLPPSQKRGDLFAQMQTAPQKTVKTSPIRQFIESWLKPSR